MIKRVFDFMIACLFFFVFWPIFIIIALMIKLDSEGPVFYRQIRLRENKKAFHMFKFRKLPLKYDSYGPGVTLTNDERMTPVGRILANWKLDELPQFINVLKGEMSLVGPRPETPNFVKFYREEEYRVFDVKPGIFGINQLIFRNEAELYPPNEDPEKFYVQELMPHKLQNDIAYIKKQSLHLDLKILVGCLFAVLNIFIGDLSKADNYV